LPAVITAGAEESAARKDESRAAELSVAAGQPLAVLLLAILSLANNLKNP